MENVRFQNEINYKKFFIFEWIIILETLDALEENIYVSQVPNAVLD